MFCKFLSERLLRCVEIIIVQTLLQYTNISFFPSRTGNGTAKLWCPIDPRLVKELQFIPLCTCGYMDVDVLGQGGLGAERVGLFLHSEPRTPLQNVLAVTYLSVCRRPIFVGT